LYQQVVAAHPQNAAALNDLGLCLARQGKLEPSVQALEQAIQLQPEKALYRNNAATVLVEMRHDQRAMAHLSSVHGPADVQFNMGQLMVARNRTADAERYFQAALEMNPGMKEAADALAQLPGRQPNSAWPSVPSVTTEGAPAVVETPAPTAPQAEVPQTAPTMGPQFGPQMSFPSEARAPGYGQSTYMPPAYQSPMGPYPGGYPQPNVPWVGQAPVRSLPPVGTVPAGARR
jgi:tetratricopeptide (TPR) repeat protein